MKTVYDKNDIVEEIKEVADLVGTLSESCDESIANSLFCVARMLHRIVDDLKTIAQSIRVLMQNQGETHKNMHKKGCSIPQNFKEIQ